MHALEGWKHLETAKVPAIYDPQSRLQCSVLSRVITLGSSIDVIGATVAGGWGSSGDIGLVPRLVEIARPWQAPSPIIHAHARGTASTMSAGGPEMAKYARVRYARCGW
jgi:hypothetical protein